MSAGTHSIDDLTIGQQENIYRMALMGVLRVPIHHVGTFTQFVDACRAADLGFEEPSDGYWFTA